MAPRPGALAARSPFPVLIVLAATLAACDAPPAPETPRVTAEGPCVLTAGWDPHAPYRYADERGAVRGVDAEITALLALGANCQLQPVSGDWIDLLARLRDGQLDVLLAATPVAERDSYARFSTPYRHESFRLYVRKKDLDALRSLDLTGLAAAGHRVAYVRDRDYGGAVSGLAGSGRLVAVRDTEGGLARLLDRGVDAVIDDPVSVAQAIQRHAWGARVVPHPFEIVRSEVALMFSRKTVAEGVVQRFDRAIAERRADGGIGRVIERYAAQAE